jgi:hypothetical protein
MVVTSTALEERRREPARRAGRSIFFSMPWVPAIAALIMLLVLLALGEPSGEHDLTARILALAIGIAGSCAIWLINLAVVAGASTPAAHPRQYAELRDQVLALEVQVTAAKQSHEDAARCPSCRLAATELDVARDRLGLNPQSGAKTSGPAPLDLSWARGWAYSDVWNSIHRAEEALVLHMSPDELRAAVTDSLLTIKGSPLAEPLTQELKSIACQLTDAGGADDHGAALRVMRVRRRINRFQDDRWDGIRTARDRLGTSALLTSWAFFSLVALAALWGAELHMMAAAGAYLLVGALVGLFAQLRADAASDDAIEDFGLAQVRLIQTMLASGLAGTAGVVLAGVGTGAGLEEIFDLARNPMGLVVAAGFGLSPQLLIAGLQAKGEHMKADIASLHTAGEPEVKKESRAARTG